jgi:ABC-type thiamine transport system substrate-binding protein
MDIDEKERLARTKDISPDAIRARLVAARKSVGMQQIEIAAATNTKITTYNSQELRGAPSLAVMRYFHRNHRIDFNFILHGDFVQLPFDVQNALFEQLDRE